VAIKIVKNKKAYKNQAVVEIKFLSIVNRLNLSTEKPLFVEMLDFFVFREHPVIVFELLEKNLFDTLEAGQLEGFSLTLVLLFIMQILDALEMLKSVGIIHCDLKPENIMLKNTDFVQIKIIDLGGACFDGHSFYIYI